MKYIALLRGINVGGNNKIEMKKLKVLFEGLGYAEVQTYINSGNVIFSSAKGRDTILKEVTVGLKKTFGYELGILIKTQQEMRKIAEAIPENWQNDEKQKTDVAYLFPELDSKNILNELPVNREFIDVRYVKGALFWNIDRKNYNKSRINKIIGQKIYQLMTLRNVNTARYLAKACFSL